MNGAMRFAYCALRACTAALPSGDELRHNCLRWALGGCRWSQGRNLAGIYPAHGMPEIVTALQIEPQRRTVAAELADANGHFRCHRLLLVENIVKRLPGNAEQRRHFALRFADGRKHILAQDSTRVRRRPLRIAAGMNRAHCSLRARAFSVSN